MCASMLLLVLLFVLLCMLLFAIMMPMTAASANGMLVW